MGASLLAIGCRVRFAGKVYEQLLRLDLYAGDPGINQGAVVNRLGQFEVLPNRSDDYRLDRCRGR